MPILHRMSHHRLIRRCFKGLKDLKDLKRLRDLKGLGVRTPVLGSLRV